MSKIKGARKKLTCRRGIKAAGYFEIDRDELFIYMRGMVDEYKTLLHDGETLILEDNGVPFAKITYEGEAR